MASHSNLLVFSSLVFVLVFMSLGIYRTIAYVPLKRMYFTAAKGYIYGIAIILSTLFLAENFFYTREFLVLYFFLFVPLYMGVWALLRRVFRMLRHLGYGQWNTLVIGTWKNLDGLLERLLAYPDLGYEPVQIMKAKSISSSPKRLHVEPATVDKAITEKNVEYMVLSSPELNGSYDELTELCKKHLVRMRVVSPETDWLFKQIGIYDIAGFPLFSPRRQRIDGGKRFAKRMFDIAGSSALLILLSPLFFVVAVATKLESRGPVFFKQRRALTDKDKAFEFYKFRSMYHEADEKKESLFHKNESNGALFKIKNDPRLTKVGKYLRRYSIDELPQLLNVVKGEMSLVGPRPLPVADFKRIRQNDDVGSFFRARASLKPGMTGLWQVSGRSELGFREMVMLDLYYVENQSLLFDVEILAKTIPVVLFGKGAY